MLRRLHKDQPESFAFTPDNHAWAEAQIKKYPEGRQASAIIPLLWRAQEQEGWLSRPAIEHVAAMLDLAYIRALEVATFYFMFQLQPVGAVAHIQISCGRQNYPKRRGRMVSQPICVRIGGIYQMLILMA